MATALQRPEPPSSDKRWKIVNTTMRRHAHASRALIEGLHSARETFGSLDQPMLEYIAASLGVPLSKAYSVAERYQLVEAKPAAHKCVVCTGAACHAKGAGELLQSIEVAYEVKNGEATPNGEFKVRTRCLGACSRGAVATFDDDLAFSLTPGDGLKRLARWKKPQ